MDEEEAEDSSKIVNIGSLSTGKSLNINTCRADFTVPCLIKSAYPSRNGKFLYLTGENYQIVKFDLEEDKEALLGGMPVNAWGRRG